MKEYQVNLIEKNQLTTAGILNPVLWENANCLTDFSSPWKTDSFSRIEFRALWDLEFLYFNFRVFDTNIYIDRKDDSVESIGNSDRVELFFRADNSLNPYYCLEMDTAARIMDFKALPEKNFDFNWNWPESGLELKPSKDDISFTVEGKISVQSLNELNLIHDNIIETGVYRAKFSEIGNQEYEPTWISWVDPLTETPNFHIASSFGKFKLMV